jgi:EAL domain-containing protein (putative c-di-GMP-specific phosphodiesterase class I)
MRSIIASGPDMVFQPIIELRHSRPVGFEALARFNSSPSPARTFALAWTLGLGVELELAAVDAALRHLSLFATDEFLAINVSPAVVLDDRFVADIVKSGRNRIVVEVTEHQPVESYEDLNIGCKRLREAGIRIAIDDANAGYPSLHHIKMLVADIVKVDIALTRDIDHDPAKRALAGSLLRFSHEADLTIIAKGIETEADLLALQNLGVPWGQGFHLGRPDQLTGGFRPVFRVG